LEFTWVLLGLAVAGYYFAKEANPKGLEYPTLRVDVLGVKIDNVAMSQALGRVNSLFRLKEIGKSYIVTPNPEMVMLAQKDKDFCQILNGASLAVPDGIGLVWGSRILGTPLAERVTGTDLFFELCAQTARRGGRVFFLEGPEGLRTSAKAAQVLKEKFPKLNVGTLIADGSPGNDAETVRQVNQSTTQPIDLLFVAYGHGNQEHWIKRNLSKLNVKVAMGVGGAFDFIAGVQVRAPRLVRSLGLEWFYRLTHQYKERRINRLKRQVLSLIPFIFLIFKESWKS